MDNLLGGLFGRDSFKPFDHETASRHYNQIYMSQGGQHHEASLTHEAIAAAAGFAAVHAYEAHQRANGEEVSHPVMKEIIAAIAAAEVDKLAETKGLDWLDRHKAKKMAVHQAHALAEQRYGYGNSGWNHIQSQQGPSYAYNFGRGDPYVYANPYAGGYGAPSGYGGPGYGYEGAPGGYGGAPGYGNAQGYAGGPGYGAPSGYNEQAGYNNAPGYGAPGYDRPSGYGDGAGYGGSGYGGSGYGGGPGYGQSEGYQNSGYRY